MKINFLNNLDIISGLVAQYNVTVLMQLLCLYARRAWLLVPKFNVAAMPSSFISRFIYNMYVLKVLVVHFDPNALRHRHGFG